MQGIGALGGRVQWSRGLAGDLDADGEVDFADVTRLLIAWGSLSPWERVAESSRPGEGSPVEAAAPTTNPPRPLFGDLTGDGVVGMADVALLLSQFGRRSEPLPEGYSPAGLPGRGARRGDRGLTACDLCESFLGSGQCADCGTSCKDECLDCEFAGVCGDAGGGPPEGGPGDDDDGDGGTGPGGTDPGGTGPGGTNPGGTGPGGTDPGSGGPGDDDDDDGDGGNGTDCPECELFGPRFIGVGQSALIRFSPPPDPCHFYAGEWSVVSGASLIAEMRQGSDGRSLSLTAGPSPGTVRVRVRVERESGHCDYTHTFQIVEYEPITLRYTTFIPCQVEAVLDIFEWSPWYRFFGGDERVFFNAQAGRYEARFDHSSNTYRSCHQVRVRVSDHFGATEPVVLNSQCVAFGVSTGYRPDQVGPDLSGSGCEWLLHPFEEPDGVMQQQADEFNHGVALYRYPAVSNRVRIRFLLSGSNPLFPFAPPIDADFSVDVDQHIDPDTGRQRVVVRLSPNHQGAPGPWSTIPSHDKFPAHEIYVVQPAVRVLYTYSPHGTVGPWPGLVQRREIPFFQAEIEH